MYNVLIVDDEPNIRNGISCFVKWDALDCSVVKLCSNGEQAVEYLELNPVDIVVTDIRMPKMDGLQLSEYIFNHLPSVQVVILSAYSDFDYAKKAMQFHVVDYIPKNRFLEELPLVIEKCKANVNQHIHQNELVKDLKSKIDSDEHKMAQTMLALLASGNPIAEIDPACEGALTHLCNRSFVVVLCETVDGNLGPKQFLKFLKNVCLLCFTDYDSYIIPKNDGLIMLVLLENATLVQPNEIIWSIGQISQMIAEFTQYDIRIGLSSVAHDIFKLNEYYNQALLALSFTTDINSIQLFLEPAASTPGSTDITRLILKILLSIETHQFDQTMELIEQGIQASLLFPGGFESAKSFVMVIYSNILKTLSNYDLSQMCLQAEASECYQVLHLSETARQLRIACQQLIALVAKVCNTLPMNQNQIIREANAFIRSNYSENISLQSISDRVHLTPKYLSRLYKKLTGKNIIDYVNEVRIERAKEILLDPTIKVSEVAFAVGFSDASYFTHVFIKYNGKSPSEYKQGAGL